MVRCLVKISKNVVVVNNAFFMEAGGITIEDNTVVAGNRTHIICICYFFVTRHLYYYCNTIIIKYISLLYLGGNKKDSLEDNINDDKLTIGYLTGLIILRQIASCRSFIIGCKKGCKSRNHLIYILSCGA